MLPLPNSYSHTRALWRHTALERRCFIGACAFHDTLRVVR